MIGGNTLSGTAVNKAREWAKFDRLSPRMRQPVAFSPYEFVVPPVTMTPEKWIVITFRTRDAKIRAIYGPDHPQIGDRTPERRPQKSARR